MTSQSGGGGSSIPGVTSDGLTPGGLAIAGEVLAGDEFASLVPSGHLFYGSAEFVDREGNNVDGDYVTRVWQGAALPAGSTGLEAQSIRRTGDISLQDYSRPVVRVEDITASVQPLASWEKQFVVQAQVHGDGFLVHGKFKTGASVAHVLGAYSGNAVPIYDESGTLLGYMPLYA